MGFVRLSRYGLILTPEGRIMSMRPAVLDDGMGGRIVGWRDRDLAAAELQPWEPARPAAPKAVAAPVATPRISAPVAPRAIAPLRPAPPPIPVAAPVAAQAPTPVPAPAKVAIAAPQEEDEDEWEWEIALARARAAAEEELTAKPPARPSRRSRQNTVPPPIIVPTLADAAPKFVEAKTLPLPTVATSSGWEDNTDASTQVTAPRRFPKATPAPEVQLAQRPPERRYPRAASPVTVIPIPKLPRVTGQHLAPVIKPRATKPLVATPPPIRPADNDRTSPGMMAVPARVVALPRIPGLKR